MKIRRFTYTKDNGEVSERLAVIVSEPRKNYLVYDISSFEPQEVELLENILRKSEGCTGLSFAKQTIIKMTANKKLYYKRKQMKEYKIYLL